MDAPKYARRGREGIYYRGSKIDFSSSEVQALLLHELMHLVVRGDEGTLTHRVGIPQPSIPYSHSQANSDYFIL